MEAHELIFRLFGHRPYSFALYSEPPDMPLLAVRSRGMTILGKALDATQAMLMRGYFRVLVLRFDFTFDSILLPEEAEELLWIADGPMPADLEFAFFTREEIVDQLRFLALAQGERSFRVLKETPDHAQLFAECHPGERLAFTWFARAPFPG